MLFVPFTIYKYDNTIITPVTGYSLPFEVFRFSTDFTAVSSNVSDKRVIWNFGDGTTSTDLTAFHSYTYPGKYAIQLTIFDQFGQGLQNGISSSISIVNYVSDSIILTTMTTPVLTSSCVATPIFVTRYNSWQMSNSAQNTVLQLGVSGNHATFFSASAYNSDKFAHLKPLARFALSGSMGLSIVDTVSTSNIPLYTAVNGTTYFTGSSGWGSFFYIEDSKP